MRMRILCKTLKPINNTPEYNSFIGKKDEAKEHVMHKCIGSEVLTLIQGDD